MISRGFRGFFWAFLVGTLGFCRPAAAAELFVEALFPGRAVLMIDGQRYTLRVGERNGVLLMTREW